MPQVSVNLWSGKSEQQKTHLANAITKSAMEILHYGEKSVSVAIEKLTLRIGRTRFTNRIFNAIRRSSTRSQDTT
ncbi:MAG: tautomerase family protein [Acidobacteriaceae bacterium]|nr:tautomerase family protein [Acidobacteriaceae bacterium]MBV8571582.1 tautomerase family protein [Acidobacteriaceae bacterium]